VEKCIAVQIHEHLSNNNLYEQFQSGFCPHSTETAFVRRTQPILTPKVSPNSLPLDVHNSDCLLTFKTRLKTCLFIEAFYNMLYWFFYAPYLHVAYLLCVLSHAVTCLLLVRWPWVLWKAPLNNIKCNYDKVVQQTSYSNIIYPVLTAHLCQEQQEW